MLGLYTTGSGQIDVSTAQPRREPLGVLPGTGQGHVAPAPAATGFVPERNRSSLNDLPAPAPRLSQPVTSHAGRASSGAGQGVTSAVGTLALRDPSDSPSGTALAAHRADRMAARRATAFDAQAAEHTLAVALRGAGPLAGATPGLPARRAGPADTEGRQRLILPTTGTPLGSAHADPSPCGLTGPDRRQTTRDDVKRAAADRRALRLRACGTPRQCAAARSGDAARSAQAGPRPTTHEG